MSDSLIGNLVKIGFSEYEAKAYVALLRKSPVSGYELAKVSSVPRSMIYEVMGKLTARGAAMTLRTGGTTKYAPIPASEFLSQLQREQENLLVSLQDELSALSSLPDLDYVWNIEGHENVVAKALEMINQSAGQVYLALLPITFPELEPALIEAIDRGVRVVIYTTGALNLPGAQVVAAHVSDETLGQIQGLGLILSIDGKEVLIGEWLAESQARASWTSSPLMVFMTEHHLRTDLYLPQILALLGDDALDVIQEEDRELFALALESRLNK
jgi:sugar-specific transcriptional regulator TrmB